MLSKSYVKEILINTIVIFVSYIIAVFIRYRILDSKPGVAALSVPYLMVALIYRAVFIIVGNTHKN